jgi:hypothetical protein
VEQSALDHLQQLVETEV